MKNEKITYNYGDDRSSNVEQRHAFNEKTSLDDLEEEMDHENICGDYKRLVDFGQNRNKILSKMDLIREQQKQIFIKQMEYEISTTVDTKSDQHHKDSNLYHTNEKNSTMEDLSEKFQKEFEKNEGKLDHIRSLLENLSSQTKEVADLCFETSSPPSGINHEVKNASPRSQ